MEKYNGLQFHLSLVVILGGISELLLFYCLKVHLSSTIKSMLNLEYKLNGQTKNVMICGYVEGPANGRAKLSINKNGKYIIHGNQCNYSLGLALEDENIMILLKFAFSVIR